MTELTFKESELIREVLNGVNTIDFLSYTVDIKRELTRTLLKSIGNKLKLGFVYPSDVMAGIRELAYALIIRNSK